MASTTAHSGLGIPEGFSDLVFVPAKEVVESLQQDGVVVVDVREESEFSTGYITDAKNIPSGKFQDEQFLQSLLTDELKTAKTIVVHCAKSQHRGPTCARALAQALEKIEADNKPSVQVLTGGITAFKSEVGDDSPLLSK